ncbi:MAG: sulfatase-like hydrolase/transferase, partial [Pirellulaceae bacterium]|nr:sulfatase-like hydrolase/transferase [Pirellulaceae bacterium]
QVIDRMMGECAETKQPFCLFACSNEPHSPWDKGDASRYPPESIKLPPYIVDTPVVRETFSRYLAEITYYDQQVGQILELLDKHGQADNTLVMVVSEQGNAFPFAKWTCYGHGLQSAMIVRWPGQVAAGSRSDAMVEYTDVVPTFVQVAGGTPSDHLDGESFVDVLVGKSDKHKSFVFGEMTTRGIINGSDVYAIRTVRDERYRLIWNLHHDRKFTNACTKADYFQSMVAKADAGDANAKRWVDRYHYRPEFELFDCQSDPLELNNLAADANHAETISRLKGRLTNWMESQGDEGKLTEADAILHQNRYKGMSREEALDAYENRKDRAVENKKPSRGGKARKKNPKKDAA